MTNVAIVTGASSGVGREFVRQLDLGKGGPLDEIWLIARSTDRLEQIAEETVTDCRVFALDLTKDSSFLSVRDALEADDSIRVQWLINSAGYGKFGRLDEISSQDNADMIRLNCIAVVEMCYHALPRMVPGSRIVNMSSIAGIAPQPELSVYSASKRFVLDFSRTLDHELSSVGVHVTAVCPKFMDTGFLDKPGNPESVRRMTSIGFERPVDVVRKALRAAVLGRATCVPSPDMKVVHVACKVLPSGLVLTLQDLVFGLATRSM
jgi:Short-chain dehydrogenases of various substrate specificities